MNNSDWTAQAMAYIDGELPPAQARGFEVFLANHPDIAAQVREMAELKGLTARARPPQPPTEYWDQFPRDVWGRIAKRGGWLLYLVGALILALYAVIAFLTSGAHPWIKVGVACLLLGTLVLFASVLRQRMREAKTDRYSSEVMK